MMSEEIRVSLTTIEVEEITAPRAHTGFYEDWCMHQGCRRWGSFGYDRRFGTVWFCGEHKDDGESGR